ncbi:MAG TPA: hypothetical protein VFP53_09785 [Sphingomicrobium sp.]|nr:hypothetical protein [Sphingomicrobium sp.]
MNNQIVPRLAALRKLLGAVLLLSIVRATPLAAADWTGHWVLRSAGTAIFDYSIERSGSGWKVDWRRPAHFQLGSSTLSKIEGPPVTLPPSEVVETKDGLTLRFVSNGEPLPSIVLRHRTEGLASLTLADTFGPFTLSLETEAPALGPWDIDRSYPIEQLFATNAEMTALFEADQASRQDLHIDWKQVSVDDARRRKRTRQLLDQEKLQSGDDYYHAAFVFQHGSEASDYLLAHVLALAAMARGRPDAGWIAAATLDRYLHHEGSKQVLGTQYEGKNCRWTMEPYDRGLVPDSVRQALGVPPIAKQGSVMSTPPPC